MSGHPMPLTDDVLAWVVRKRALEPDPGLLDRIVEAAEATPQDRSFLDVGWGWHRPRNVYAGAALAIALLAALGIYLASVGAFDRIGSPSPTPESSRLFLRPFTYTTPEGTDLTLSNLGSTLIAFTDGGQLADRGVVVAAPGDGPFGATWWCFGPIEFTAEPAVEQFIRALEGAMGAAVQPLDDAATFDGQPAVLARVDRARCPMLRATERGPRLQPEPGLMYVLDVEGATVAVVVWGHTEAILDEWLPTGQQFAQTIHFVLQKDPP